MPYLKLNTNVTITEESSPLLLSKLSQLVAKETGKPERYVMVEIVENKNMLFADSNSPLAYLECKSIDLSPAQAKSLSVSISLQLKNLLQIEPDRVYIEFSACPAEYWGWNSFTFG